MGAKLIGKGFDQGSSATFTPNNWANAGVAFMHSLDKGGSHVDSHGVKLFKGVKQIHIKKHMGNESQGMGPAQPMGW
jgi:hypothetical protein